MFEAVFMKRSKSLFLGLAILGLTGVLAILGCPSAEQSKKPADESSKKALFSPQALDHFRQAHKFLAEKKMDEALKEFQETVRLSPDSSLATYWLGKAYFYQKEKEQAEKLFKKVLEMDPQNYHAMAMLGRLYSFDRDKLNQAEDYLKKALDYSPENLEAHFDLARVYARKGERTKALQQFRFLFAKESEFFIYHFELGRMLEAWGQKEQALREYRRAQLLNPRFEPASQAIKRLESVEKTPDKKSEGPTTQRTTTKPTSNR